MIEKWAPGPTLAAALVVSALLATAAPAQEATPEQEPQGEQDQSEIRESQQAPAQRGSEDSPYDYKSSEEISEDLSVSFPVDI